MTDESKIPEVQETLQALWQDQPTEPVVMSLEQVHSRALKFQSQEQWVLVIMLIEAVLMVLMTAFVIVSFDDRLLRAAYLLTMLGALFALYYRQAHKISDRKAVLTASQACFDYYRHSLIKRIELTQTAWAWVLLPILPGVCLLFYRMNQVIATPHPQAQITLGSAKLILYVCEAICVLTIIQRAFAWSLRIAKLRKELNSLGG